MKSLTFCLHRLPLVILCGVGLLLCWWPSTMAFARTIDCYLSTAPLPAAAFTTESSRSSTQLSQYFADDSARPDNAEFSTARLRELSQQIDSFRNQLQTLRSALQEQSFVLERLVSQIESLKKNEARQEGHRNRQQEGSGENPNNPPLTLDRILSEASPEAIRIIGQIGLAAVIANPHLLVESISSFMQERREQEQHLQPRQVPPDLLAEVFDTNNGLALRAGAVGAARRIAIMTDHNCPFCRRAALLVRQLLARGDLEVYIYELPIISPQSMEAALVSLAAARIDPAKALDLYFSVGNHQGMIDGRIMLQKAVELGFDRARLVEEMTRPESRRAIDRSLSLARRLGITGTPGFIIQNVLIQGLQPEQIIQALNGR